MYYYAYEHKHKQSHENFEELILGGMVGSPTDPSLTSSKPANSDIVPILKSQRDRFKQRSDELESQCRIHVQRIQQLEMELGGLKQDNVKLYEKMRYLESYRQQGSNSASSPPV
jgi:homeobox protein cut-like